MFSRVTPTPMNASTLCVSVCVFVLVRRRTTWLHSSELKGKQQISSNTVLAPSVLVP